VHGAWAHLGVRLPPPLPAAQAHRLHASAAPGRWKVNCSSPARAGADLGAQRGLRRHAGRSGVSHGGAAVAAAPTRSQARAFETWQSRYPGREGWDGRARRKPSIIRRSRLRGAALARRVGRPARCPRSTRSSTRRRSRLSRSRGYFEIGLACACRRFSPTPPTEQKRRYAPARRSAATRSGASSLEPAPAPTWRRLRTPRPRDGDDWVQRSEDLDLGAHGGLGHRWSRAAIPRPPDKGLTFFFLSMKGRRASRPAGSSRSRGVHSTRSTSPTRASRTASASVGRSARAGAWHHLRLMNERLTPGRPGAAPTSTEIFGRGRAHPARGRARHRPTRGARAAADST